MNQNGGVEGWNNNKILETERLYLRRMTQDDYCSLCKILQDPEVMYAYEHAFSGQEVQEWLDRQLERYEEYGFGLWAVILKETGEMIGQCGITMQDWNDRRVPEIGYLFQKSCWHRGYAMEATNACRDYAFQTLDMEEVFSIIRETNLASIRVAERNGMSLKGSFVKHYYHCDMPHLVYSVEREPKHRRRVRYKGTHPRRFEEKYKELDPLKYADTVEKVIRKGSTPAGMHISICVREILDFLKIRPGQTGLDATLGYGGHTQKMLECLKGEGHLFALDVDPIELAKTRERLGKCGYGPEILTIRQMNFADIDQLAAETGPFDFALADLGVSSMQIDNPERGFSYKQEGPLDLRLNPEKGIPASERLREITREELEGMLLENADEPYAAQISRAVFSEIRKGREIATTTQLREIIGNALSFLPENERKEGIKKSCQRTFQALRIDVNSEFEVLEEFLEKLPDVLKSGGRVAILTFHSGEDRLVKKSFQRLCRAGVYQDFSREVIRPSAEECAMNSRARSTKMRWAVKA